MVKCDCFTPESCDELFLSARNRTSVHNRRSPESNVSYGGPPIIHETNTSPAPTMTNRTNAFPTGGGGYVSPEYAKPPTPYEDKVIPTLRNRNRQDGGQVQNSVTASAEFPPTTNEETESLYGGTNTAANEDTTAELNQAEMIEANQMMIVFDKQLVSNELSSLLPRILFVFTFKDQQTLSSKSRST